jgi:hypothetical protein
MPGGDCAVVRARTIDVGEAESEWVCGNRLDVSPASLRAGLSRRQKLHLSGEVYRNGWIDAAARAAKVAWDDAQTMTAAGRNRADGATTRSCRAGNLAQCFCRLAV